MLEEFDKLATAMIKLKREGQLDEFRRCCEFDSSYRITDASSAKLRIAIAGLDDAAYCAVDAIERIDNG